MSKTSNIINSPTLEQIHQSVLQESQDDRFKLTFERLWELREIDLDLQDDDDEVFCPSDYAFSNAIYLIWELYQSVGELFPLGYVSVDSQGGVNLIWKCKETGKEVRFNLPYTPQNSRSSVYLRHNSQSHLIEQPSVTQLLNFLRWLNANSNDLMDFNEMS
jgi:hypothetical protein